MLHFCSNKIMKLILILCFFRIPFSSAKILQRFSDPFFRRRISMSNPQSQTMRKDHQRKFSLNPNHHKIQSIQSQNPHRQIHLSNPQKSNINLNKLNIFRIFNLKTNAKTNAKHILTRIA